MAMQEKVCLCISHGNGVQEFVLMEATRPAIDAFFGHVAVMLETSTTESVQHILLDVRPSGAPPINHMVLRSRQFNGQYPRHALRIAVVYGTNSMLPLLETALYALKRSQRDDIRFFEEDHAAALRWLMRQD
ncbi:MAG: hypothetical protein OHK0046_19570 [Anaerolineae bacterium]